MNVPDLQAEALAGIESLRASGAREVLAVIPAYIGPWAVSAMDAARFLAGNPNEQALFVYDHEPTRERFAQYMAPLVGNVTIASPQTVARGGHAHYAYVASPDDAWHLIWEALDPEFVLRHTQATYEGADTDDIVVMPSYRQAGGRRLGWGDADSIRYYSELYFGQGGPVTGDEINRLANAGEGPHKIRTFQQLGSLDGLRNAAGLGDDVIYHRGLSVQQRAELLKNIGESLGYTPSVEEIRASLKVMKGPNYDTLIKDVGLPALREMAGQDPAYRREAARRAAMADWTAADSARLYRELSDAAGKPLTRRELEKTLARLKQLRRPNILEIIAPFATPDQNDNKLPFDRMREAAYRDDPDAP